MESQIIRDTKLKVQAANLVLSKGSLEKGDSLPEETEAEGLPTLRSSGIALGRNGLSTELNTKFVQANILSTSLLDENNLDPALKVVIPSETLFVEDITMGYRMDIAYMENPDSWYSLHWKKDKVSYFDRQNQEHTLDDLEDDEGFIEIPVTEKNEIPFEYFVGETMMRWEGWSLSARRPGYAITQADETGPDPDEAKDFVNTSKTAENAKYALDPDLQFRMNAEPQVVPGTLPKLRFGQKYAVRSRIVDIAGNSVPLETKAENRSATVIDDIIYLRHDPVNTPVLLLGSPCKDAESPESMTIRSNYDQDSDNYENSVGGGKFSPTSRRHLVAPKNSQAMAEHHGRFDAAFEDPSKAKDLYQLITSRDADFPQNGNRQEVFQQDDVDLVYLPDPMAAGVSLYAASDANDTHTQDIDLIQLSFFQDQEVTGQTNSNIPAEDWYKAKSVRVELKEGDALGAAWSNAQRVLTVSLPKGMRVKLRYSAFWRGDDVARYSAIWKKIEEANPQNMRLLQGIMRDGKHWMISPFRELELVHAVQQPVKAPLIHQVWADREYGDVDARIHVRFSVHGNSTEQLDFETGWQEVADRLSDPGPVSESRQGQINNVKVAYHETEVTWGYMPAGPGQLTPINKDRPSLNHVFEDTRFRRIRINPLATSRYSDHFKSLEPGMLDFTRKGDWFEDLIIPSSARPKIPEVDYILPTFEWRRSSDSTTMRHHRVGGGLRIYLKRPWYSSGEGEQLAVIYQGKHTSDPTRTLSAGVKPGYQELVTQWAADPIKLSVPKGAGPAENDFRFNPTIDKGLSYEGYPSFQADIAAYPVQFDSERNLHYCDISIDPGRMYFPFVRLALARYQQHSLRKDGTDVCLSPVVFPDFIQLMPDRISELKFQKDDQNSRFTISVEGPISGYGSFGNYLEFSFLSSDLAQPIRMAIDDGTNDKQMEDERMRVDITETDIQSNYFKITREFKLNRRYKDEPFVILIQEFEKVSASVSSLMKVVDERVPRLVYADRFNINATE